MVVAQETKWKVDWTCLIQPTEALEWCKPMPCLRCVLSSLPWGEKHEPPPICFRSRVSSQVLLMDSQSSFLSALFSPCLAFCADLSSLLLVPDGFWLLSVSCVCQSNHWEPLQHIKFMKYKHKLAQANIMDQYLTASRLLKSQPTREYLDFGILTNLSWNRNVHTQKKKKIHSVSSGGNAESRKLFLN